MKKTLFILFLAVFTGNIEISNSQVNQAVTYFPLKVGNVWVYYCSAFGMNPPCICTRKYRFQITSTTVRNNKTYFLFQRTQVDISPYCSMCYAPPYPDTLRIDSASGNIYRYSAANGCSYSPFEILFDSLNARKNDTVRNDCGVSQWRYICGDTSNQSVFGTGRKTKYFNELQFESSYDRTFAQGIGIIRAGLGGRFCSQNFSALIGCVLDGVLYGDTSMLVGLYQISSEIPDNFSLSQNYPNPFNPSTKIKFSIPQYETSQRDVSTKLIVYDALGREVQMLVNENLSPGTYEVDFDGINLPSGVYYYELVSGDFFQAKKMLMVK